MTFTLAADVILAYFASEGSASITAYATFSLAGRCTGSSRALNIALDAVNKAGLALARSSNDEYSIGVIQYRLCSLEPEPWSRETFFVRPPST